MAIKIPSRIFFTILCSILIIFVSNRASSTAQPFLYYSCRNSIGNYTTNSTYESNLNHLLSNIVPSNDNYNASYGFYNSSYGENSDKVHAIGHCRGDIKPDACHKCLNDSIHVIREVCPNKMEAIGMYPLCMLRYSNRSIFSRSENFPRYWRANGLNVSTNVDVFFEELRALLNSLKNQAVAAFPRKFATGNVTTPDFQAIYALVQCTPDLSRQQCNNCLDEVFKVIPECCTGKIGGRVLSPSCNFRYETGLFYEPIEDVVATTLSPPVSPVPSSPLPTNSTISSTARGIRIKDFS